MYLCLVVECYKNLNDEGNLFKTLAVLNTLHPYLLNTRYELIKKENTGEFSVSNATADCFNKESFNEALRYAKKEALKKDYFNEVSVEQASFILELIFLTKKYGLIKEVCKRVLASKYRFLGIIKNR